MGHEDLQWTAMRAMVAGLHATGVEHCVVAPGSRSTPLTLAFARHPAITVHVVIDERSAGFRALGIGRATARPAAVVCTSGSATAHLFPAILEAHHGRVPLVVLTADRPPEFLDTGAGQTIDQAHLYGNTVRWFAAPGVADPATLPTFAPAGVRAGVAACGPVAGPVHLNIALREPLVSEAGVDGGFEIIDVARDEPTVSSEVIASVATRLRAASRGVVVAGWGSNVGGGVLAALAKDLGWPLLADPISGARVGPNAISTYESLIRTPDVADAFGPDVVLRFGAPLTSRLAGQWLSQAPTQIVVDPLDSWLDPHRTATMHVRADAAQLAGRLSLEFSGGGFRSPNPTPSTWLAGWRGAERRARAVIDAHLDADDVAFDGRIARDVLAALPDGSHLLVASSMPVRDLEWFAAPRAGVTVHANRGVNGIDGLVSTAAGIATGAAAPTVALLGDLALLHDSNGLNGLRDTALDLTLVVVDNDGGGIFSFLPQADACSPDEFETLFGTPHGLDLAELINVYGIPVATPASAATFDDAVRAAVALGGVRAVVVRTDRTTNVARHRSVWEAVASRVRS
jgi:2-succinyl-5-enolpyruvyl-6-hydroxy-3-cyclohexene-1-carboxylate synthase